MDIYIVKFKEFSNASWDDEDSLHMDKEAAERRVKELLEEYDAVWVMTMPVRYAHRNGETDEPEIDGVYWVSQQPDMMMPIAFWSAVAWSNEQGWETPTYPLAIHGPIPYPRGNA